MATDPTVLQTYVPSQLINWLGEQGTQPIAPASKEQRLVAWFADLSNFSHLTDEITRRDRSGPELVGRLLNETFGSIVETVERYGGQVLDFAGDSVLATWLVDEDDGLDRALTLAARCGLATVQLNLPEVYAQLPPLDLRVGVGVGTGFLIQVGGVGDQWHFMMGGPPFDQIGVASSVARPGEVVLSPEASRRAGSAVRGRLDVAGFMRLTDVDDIEPVDATSQPEMTPALLERIRRFLSPTVLSRIDAGPSEWLSEFRQVTSVFVNLPELDMSSRAARDALQDVVSKTQTTLVKFEGTLSRVLDDDKGVSMMVAFGLPPFAHQEDPYLGVQAAEEIQNALTAMRLRYGIGVATGRAFCGVYGSPDRRDYTTLGREVNLAARLMQAARFEILCDAATKQAARRVEFHEAGVRTLRGWDRPVEVFKPLWEKSAARLDQHARGALFGRESEQSQLTGWLGALARAHSSAVVLIEGEPGIGKSALAADLIRTADSFDVQVLQGAALPVAQAPYQAWRDVISDVLDLTEIRSLERRQEMVRTQLGKWPEFAEWEALLNSVLDLDFPETALTRGMSGRNRRDSTVELIGTILAEAAAESPLLIVLDDLHWFDSASWAVTLATARKVSPVLLVLLTRPMPEPPEQMEELFDVSSSARIVLGALNDHDSLALAQERLGARSLSPDVANLILETAEGVPFFVEELALSLRDSEGLEISDGVARLARSADELGVPESLSSVVLSRIDRLNPPVQLTLKVASVIGRSFGTRELEAVHPSHPGVDELARQMAELVELGLIVESSPGSYDFRHSLTRDTAYGLLLFDQRGRIHHGVAAYLESQADLPQEPQFGLLAYHWERGGDPRRALEYFEKSGASTLRKGANEEAIFAHSRSVELLSSNPEVFADVHPIRQSQWHFEIGQAYEALGRFADAEKSLYRALAVLGVHVSASPLRRSLRLAWEAIKQVMHIALPGAIAVPDDAGESARLGQAARIAALLGEVYYFTGDLTGFPTLNLIAINLGEKSGEPLVAGLAYSSTGYLVGTLRLRRLADRYFKLARAAEDLEWKGELVPMPFVLELDEMAPGHLIAVALAESVLALTFDEWSRARQLADEGLRRCDRLGDKYSAGIALAVRGFVSYSSGAIDDALRDYTQLLASARQRSNREHEGWASSFVIPVLLGLDRLDEAQAMSASAVAIINDVDPLTVPVIHGTRSQVQLRSGQAEAALASAELALETMDNTPIFIYLAAYAGMLDTLLELWSAHPGPSDNEADRLARLTHRGVKKMRGFARVLPFARPKYQMFKGRMEGLQGKGTKAQRSFRKGLKLAQDSGFTWDEGLLHLELARTLPADSPERRSHLSEARRNLEVVASRHDLYRLQALGG